LGESESPVGLDDGDFPGHDGRFGERCRACGPDYGFYGKPENHENALVELVVIARRLEEEKVVAMLEVIEDALAVES